MCDINNTLNAQNVFYKQLFLIKNLFYDKCGFTLTSVEFFSECLDYGACCFNLNNKRIQHRFSKITPSKAGQFVSIWKRNKEGVTEPFDFSDDLDFIIITSINGDNLGQFIFSKAVLANFKIITKNGVIGKRGIRVYPPWEVTTSKQAKKTQSWQTKYFLSINSNNSTDFEFAKYLLTNHNFVI